VTRKAHNVDRERTFAAYQNGHFQDSRRRSYWTNAGHEYLFGIDASNRRSEIYERDKGECQLKLSVMCDPSPGWSGHMHHIKGGNTDDRCWCPHNLEWACGVCHSVAHVHVMSGKVNA